MIIIYHTEMTHLIGQFCKADYQRKFPIQFIGLVQLKTFDKRIKNPAIDRVELKLNYLAAYFGLQQ